MLLSQTNKSRLSPEEWRREERETGSVSFTLRQSKLKVYVLVRPPIDLRLCIYIWWMSDTQSHGIPGIKTKVLFRREKNGGSGATWRSLGASPGDDSSVATSVIIYRTSMEGRGFVDN